MAIVFSTASLCVPYVLNSILIQTRGSSEKRPLSFYGQGAWLKEVTPYCSRQSVSLHHILRMLYIIYISFTYDIYHWTTKLLPLLSSQSSNSLCMGPASPPLPFSSPSSPVSLSFSSQTQQTLPFYSFLTVLSVESVLTK